MVSQTNNINSQPSLVDVNESKSNNSNYYWVLATHGFPQLMLYISSQLARLGNSAPLMNLVEACHNKADNPPQVAKLVLDQLLKSKAVDPTAQIVEALLAADKQNPDPQIGAWFYLSQGLEKFYQELIGLDTEAAIQYVKTSLVNALDPKGKNLFTEPDGQVIELFSSQGEDASVTQAFAERFLDLLVYYAFVSKIVAACSQDEQLRDYFFGENDDSDVTKICNTYDLITGVNPDKDNEEAVKAHRELLHRIATLIAAQHSEILTSAIEPEQTTFSNALYLLLLLEVSPCLFANANWVDYKPLIEGDFGSDMLAKIINTVTDVVISYVHEQMKPVPAAEAVEALQNISEVQVAEVTANDPTEPDTNDGSEDGKVVTVVIQIPKGLLEQAIEAGDVTISATNK